LGFGRARYGFLHGGTRVWPAGSPEKEAALKQPWALLKALARDAGVEIELAQGVTVEDIVRGVMLVDQEIADAGVVFVLAAKTRPSLPPTFFPSSRSPSERFTCSAASRSAKISRVLRCASQAASLPVLWTGFKGSGRVLLV